MMEIEIILMGAQTLVHLTEVEEVDEHQVLQHDHHKQVSIHSHKEDDLYLILLLMMLF